MSTPSYRTTTYQSEPNDRLPSQRPIWLIFLVSIGGLSAFLLIVGRKEIARWHYAAATNAIQDGRHEEAVEAANRGLRWDPDYVELINLRAFAHLENKEFEQCLADYDQIIEIAARNKEVTRADIEPLAGKANALQRLNRYDEAIELWDKIVEFRKEHYRLRDDSESQYSYAMALNNRSYIQGQAFALGSKEIDIPQALDDIREALRIHEDPEDPVLIDTLGYLLLQNGQAEKAFQALDGAAKATREQNRLHRIELERRKALAVDPRALDLESKRLKRMDEHYSVILHHRGEAYQALGEFEKAQADIEEAIRLGYNREEGIW